LRQINTGRIGYSAFIRAWRDKLPGIALCALIACISLGIQQLELAYLGHLSLEAIVLAILLGMLIRSVWQPPEYWLGGVAFSAKQLLEVAVMLLGASLSVAEIAQSGPLLLGVVFTTVCVTLIFTYLISRFLGLPREMSILIACGNSICGNSAIAAVAPVIGASNEDVGASISFTAVLGVVTVLGLPLLIPLCGLSNSQYGILAGLTVYAVPQVLAATVPVSAISAQTGTVVKLLRVLLLGPIVVLLSLLSRANKREKANLSFNSVFTWVPWFIPGFLLFMAVRSFGLLPVSAITPIAKASGLLTIVSMAALGLGVDIRLVGRVGGKVTAAVSISLAALILVSLTAVRLFH